jgi:hypothetical protein
MPDEQTLLANARQSVKTEQADRSDRQESTVRQWWNADYSTIEDYAREVVPDPDAALVAVRKNLRRCKAKSREKFLVWVTLQIAKQPGFHLVANAIKKFDIDVQDFLDRAMLQSSRYADFPPHTKNGTNYLLNMGSNDDGTARVWTVPEQYWQFVLKIWPVFLKKKADGGFFIAKKVAGTVLPVHRLILPLEPKDTVQSSNGNFLDWSSLSVRPFNRSGLYEGKHVGWNQCPVPESLDKLGGRPNTLQEEFDRRLKPMATVENYGVTVDGEQFSISPPIPVNANTGTAGYFGKVRPVGWVSPITAAERDRQDSTERFPPTIRQSVRLRLAAKALDNLGL